MKQDPNYIGTGVVEWRNKMTGSISSMAEEITMFKALENGEYLFHVQLSVNTHEDWQFNGNP